VPVAADLRAWVPSWWRGETGSWTGILDVFLAPAELGFRVAVQVAGTLRSRRLLSTRRAAVPVISVGNLTVGGAGKTPVSAWVASNLAEWGCSPAILIRGYGMDEVEVHRELNPGVPVFADSDRWRAGCSAEAGGADVLILDDGFQHRRMARDLDIVLVAAESWSDRKRMLPRGPWREPVGALRRADVVLVTRKSTSTDQADRVARELESLDFAVPIGVVSIAPSFLRPLGTTESDSSRGGVERLAGQSVLAISTLADPRPFMATLRSAGANVASLIFADHHEFTDADLARIKRIAVGKVIVMTRKEAVKLRTKLALGDDAWVLDQRVTMEKGEADFLGTLKRIAGCR